VTAYHLVPVVFVSMSVAACLSYDAAIKGRWWFPWVIVGMGSANCLLWSVAARWTPDKRELYSVSLAWDVAVMVAYNVLPLVLLGVRLSPQAWVGFALVCAGAILVKSG